MNSIECTDVFLGYRELSRVIWNLGFVPFPQTLTWQSQRAYEKATAHLFEAMVLYPLGIDPQVEELGWPRAIGDFRVELRIPEADLQIDANLPDEPGRIWGKPVVRIRPGDHSSTGISSVSAISVCSKSSLIDWTACRNS